MGKTQIIIIRRWANRVRAVSLSRMSLIKNKMSKNETDVVHERKHPGEPVGFASTVLKMDIPRQTDFRSALTSRPSSRRTSRHDNFSTESFMLILNSFVFALGIIHVQAIRIITDSNISRPTIFSDSLGAIINHKKHI